MSTGYKISDQDAPYYLTFQIVKWVDIFTRKVYRDIFIDCLKYCQTNKSLEIYAYVIMSNHVHLLVRSGQGKLSDTVREIKSYTARQILLAIEKEHESRREWMMNLFGFSAKEHKRDSNNQIWTHENHAEIIYSNEFIDQKKKYIHDNPVRAGIVANPEDYLYSSARNYAGLSSVIDVVLV
jgi:Transposase and inactivated derivatives